MLPSWKLRKVRSMASLWEVLMKSINDPFYMWHTSSSEMTELIFLPLFTSQHYCLFLIIFCFVTRYKMLEDYYYFKYKTQINYITLTRLSKNLEILYHVLNSTTCIILKIVDASFYKLPTTSCNYHARHHHTWYIGYITCEFLLLP